MTAHGTEDPTYLLDGAHWALGEPGSIPSLILTHLGYTGLALAIGAALALPVGLYIGHTGRFAVVAINTGNAVRSLPVLGLISLLVTVIGLGLLPVMVALVVLAVPPILASTYAGLRAVDPTVVDAATGMGMRSFQTLLRVKIPIALPLIVSGFRSAALQVVATATVAAYVGLGGLGRLLIDGLTLSQYDRVVAGAVLVALLAIVIDLAMGLVQRLVVSPGVSPGVAASERREPRTSRAATSAE